MTLEIITETINGNNFEIAYILNEDGTTVSMPKSEYDRRQAEHFTPSV